MRQARCPPDPQLTDFQTPTNSLRFYVRLALRLLGLITFHSHTRSKALMSFGILRLEALCGYQPSSEPRPPTFSNGSEPRLNR